jgi:hypothetical protein
MTAFEPIFALEAKCIKKKKYNEQATRALLLFKSRFLIFIFMLDLGLIIYFYFWFKTLLFSLIYILAEHTAYLICTF